MNDINYNNNNIPKQIITKRNSWCFFSVSFNFLHVLLNTISISASLITIYFSFKLMREYITVFTTLSALSSILNFIFCPNRSAQGFTNAYRNLDIAIIEYQSSGSPDIKNIIEALKAGEQEIQKAHPY